MGMVLVVIAAASTTPVGTLIGTPVNVRQLDLLVKRDWWANVFFLDLFADLWLTSKKITIKPKLPYNVVS